VGLVDIITRGDYTYQVYNTGDKGYSIIQAKFNGEIVSSYSDSFSTRLEARTILNLLYLQGKLGGRLDADKN
jgi:hypothetical protein